MLRLRPRTRPCARLFSHAPLGLSTVARGEPENQTSRVTCRQTQGEWKTGGLNFAVDAPREGRGSESQPLLQMWGAGEGGALGSGRHTRRARLARCGGGRAGRPGEVSSAKVWGTMKDYSEQEQQVKAGGRRDGQCRRACGGVGWRPSGAGFRSPFPTPTPPNASAPPVLFPWFRFCSFCKAFLDKCPDGSSPLLPGPPSLALWEVQIPGLPMMPSFSASLSYIRLGHPRSRGASFLGLETVSAFFG